MTFSFLRAVALALFGLAAAALGPAGLPGQRGAEAQAVRPAARPAARPATRPVAQPARRPVHVHHHHHRPRPIVVAPVRPMPVVHPWYWGRVVAGVTIGTVIVVSAAGAVPKAPSSTLCWFWTDDTQKRGYWDYCVPPSS